MAENTVLSVDRVIEALAAATRRPTRGSTFAMKAGVPDTMAKTAIEFPRERHLAWQAVLAGHLRRLPGT